MVMDKPKKTNPYHCFRYLPYNAMGYNDPCHHYDVYRNYQHVY